MTKIKFILDLITWNWFWSWSTFWYRVCFFVWIY